MAKKMSSYRLDSDTRASLDRLQAAYGASSATEAIADAVARLETALDRASADNADAFSAAEWHMLAAVLNGTLWEPGRPPDGRWLALEVHDGHALNGEGYRWLIDAGDTPQTLLTAAQRKAGDEAAASLVTRLAALDGPHAAAVAYACRWFWAHADDPRITLDSPWWRVEWREALGSA